MLAVDIRGFVVVYPSLRRTLLQPTVHRLFCVTISWLPYSRTCPMAIPIRSVVEQRAVPVAVIACTQLNNSNCTIQRATPIAKSSRRTTSSIGIRSCHTSAVCRSIRRSTETGHAPRLSASPPSLLVYRVRVLFNFRFPSHLIFSLSSVLFSILYVDDVPPSPPLTMVRFSFHVCCCPPSVRPLGITVTDSSHRIRLTLFIDPRERSFQS